MQLVNVRTYSCWLAKTPGLLLSVGQSADWVTWPLDMWFECKHNAKYELNFLLFQWKYVQSGIHTGFLFGRGGGIFLRVNFFLEGGTVDIITGQAQVLFQDELESLNVSIPFRTLWTIPTPPQLTPNCVHRSSLGNCMGGTVNCHTLYRQVYSVHVNLIWSVCQHLT